MTAPLFLADFRELAIGDVLALTGAEGRHAATVKRLRVGEEILVADGTGRAVRGPVISVAKDRVEVTVSAVEVQPGPAPKVVVVQALAKGDRSELAVQMLTELGVDEIVPWAAERSIVKWAGERAAKSLDRWRATAREATKQSRQYRIPVIAALVSTDELVARLKGRTVFVLHEEATEWLSSQSATTAATQEVWLIVGPEGGISPAELASFTAAGAQPVKVAESVLRTSTAGVVGVAQIARHP